MAALEIVVPFHVKRIEKSAVPAALAGPDAGQGNGFEAGYEAGQLRARWETDRQRQQDSVRVQGLVKALEKLRGEYEALLAEHLPELIQGALHRVFRSHPFTAAEIAGEVSALLREMEQAGRLSLECAPAEFAELKQLLEECATVPDSSKWTLESNSTLAKGEFLLKSDLGDVDGRHASRVRQIHLALETAP